ncbi:MAG TPA: PAS domain S-box protein [Bryobacteraceae bacterium]
MDATRLRTFGLSTLALALVFVGAIALFTYRGWRHFQESNLEAEKARRVMLTGRRVLDLVVDAQGSQRGFLLTGRQAYLEPFKAAAKAVGTPMAALKALAAGRPEQERRVRALEPLIAAKFEELNRTIALRQAGRTAEALAIVQSDHGKRLMDRIREVANELEADEYGHWLTLSRDVSEGTQGIQLLSVFGAGILTLLLAASFLALQNSTTQCERLIVDLDRARQTAEESGELLRTTLYSIGDAVITTDQEGRVRMLNAVAERLTGYTEAEAEGRSIEEVFHIVNEQTRNVVESPVRNVLKNGRISGLANHTILISKTGVEVPLDDSGAPIAGRDGALKGVVLVFRDIAERKRAEEELRRSEKRFRTVADAAPVMIWSATPDGRRDYFNRTWLNFTGRSAEQEAGDGWREGIHPDDRERFSALLAQSTAASVPFTLEYRLRRHDGSYHCLLSSGVPRFGAGGELLGFLGSAVDIEDRKQAEEKVRQAAKLESLGVLAGGIAHDFNNILVGIMGNASLLEDYIAPGTPERRIVDGLLQAAERAAQLIRQMLAYSGRGRFFVEMLNLSEQARQITALIHASIPKYVTLRLSLAPDLPAVQADAAQIQQLLMNLVINAAEAVREPGGWLEISTAVEYVDAALIAASVAAEDVHPGQYVVLTVSDNGVGMDEETRARIFDPFFTTKFTGRGLGLAAALGIVRGHRGGIHVRSAPGQGTTFRVFLPAAGKYSPISEPAPEIEAGASGRILVVDDEEMVRETARAALARVGFEVLLAHDGKHALEILSGGRDGIDLVLLDLTMPELSAGETLSRIRALCPRIPVIATSGYSEMEAMERLGASIEGFLQKPFTMPQLARAVRSFMRSSGAAAT